MEQQHKIKGKTSIEAIERKTTFNVLFSNISVAVVVVVVVVTVFWSSSCALTTCLSSVNWASSKTLLILEN